MKLILLYIFLICSIAGNAGALETDEILVLANSNMPQGVELAQYYLERRHIPKENLLLLQTTTQETISRADYEKDVMQPVRQFLSDDKNRKIHCIVIFYGLPLKVASPGLSLEESSIFQILREQEVELERNLESLRPEEKTATKRELDIIVNQIKAFRWNTNRGASLDSELALVKADRYNLGMWIPNPYFIGFQDKTLPIDRDNVVITARLDGTAPDTVRRIIDDSIAAEQSGLNGSACFDARWDDPGENEVSNYALYDRSIHRAYQNVRKNSALDAKLEQTSSLLQKGDCPNTALYSGWYSLGEYVDAFDWQVGSVGYHIASMECQTLKKHDSNVWCKKMLDQGIAATIGPVEEPYVQAFPPPEIFFSYLTEGSFSLGEAYLISLPYLSWKMVLVGDPLYRVTLKKK